MINKYSVLLFAFFLMAACTNNNVYFQYHDVNPEGWKSNDVYTFNFEIEDTTSEYDVYINVRNTPEYPFQNIWLFISEMNPDSTVVNDTIEFYLADARGKWLGTGAGQTKEMPVLYHQNLRFEQAGTYQYKITHGMRVDELTGINDIGVRVEKIK